MIPIDAEMKNNFKALKNFDCKYKSNRSETNEEKVLRLPKKPIEQNNTN